MKKQPDFCDLGVEVRCLADIAFVCSCLYGEREANEPAPISNETIGNAFLGIYFYANRIADAIADLDTKGAAE